jgi:hypothetical protein
MGTCVQVKEAQDDPTHQYNSVGKFKVRSVEVVDLEADGVLEAVGKARSWRREIILLTCAPRPLASLEPGQNRRGTHIPGMHRQRKGGENSPDKVPERRHAVSTRATSLGSPLTTRGSPVLTLRVWYDGIRLLVRN